MGCVGGIWPSGSWPGRSSRTRSAGDPRAGHADQESNRRGFAAGTFGEKRGENHDTPCRSNLSNI